MSEIGFQRPKYLECDYETLTPTYGRFTAQPFERGFAVTVGNALRRILLSSIKGAAITAVRIQGVLHEFSTIPGVVEDVTDILLNLKSIPLKLNGTQPKTMTLKIEGPATAKASDIVHDSDIEILEKDIPIASLDKDGKLDIEMIVQNNRGYIIADENFDEKLSIDFIPLDSSHSPVKKVNYRVEPARVGKRIDFESLALEVWTTGAVAPDREPDPGGQNHAGPHGHLHEHRRRADGEGTGRGQAGNPIHVPDRHPLQTDRAPGTFGPVEQLPALGGDREDL